MAPDLGLATGLAKARVLKFAVPQSHPSRELRVVQPLPSGADTDCRQSCLFLPLGWEINIRPQGDGHRKRNRGMQALQSSRLQGEGMY